MLIPTSHAARSRCCSATPRVRTVPAAGGTAERPRVGGRWHAWSWCGASAAARQRALRPALPCAWAGAAPLRRRARVEAKTRAHSPAHTSPSRARARCISAASRACAQRTRAERAHTRKGAVQEAILAHSMLSCAARRARRWRLLRGVFCFVCTAQLVEAGHLPALSCQGLAADGSGEAEARQLHAAGRRAARSAQLARTEELADGDGVRAVSAWQLLPQMPATRSDAESDADSHDGDGGGKDSGGGGVGGGGGFGARSQPHTITRGGCSMRGCSRTPSHGAAAQCGDRAAGCRRGGGGARRAGRHRRPARARAANVVTAPARRGGGPTVGWRDSSLARLGPHSAHARHARHAAARATESTEHEPPSRRRRSRAHPSPPHATPDTTTRPVKGRGPFHWPVQFVTA